MTRSSKMRPEGPVHGHLDRCPAVRGRRRRGRHSEKPSHREDRCALQAPVRTRRPTLRLTARVSPSWPTPCASDPLMDDRSHTNFGLFHSFSVVAFSMAVFRLPLPKWPVSRGHPTPSNVPGRASGGCGKDIRRAVAGVRDASFRPVLVPAQALVGDRGRW